MGTKRWSALVVCGALLLGCRAPEHAGQGGAGFRQVSVEAPELPLEVLGSVCWPEEAAGLQRCALTWVGGEILFEAQAGASNATCRCLREIASSIPTKEPPSAPWIAAPPRQPVDGWAALSWVELLAPSRYGPERGLLAPAPLVGACLERGAPEGPLRFVIRHVPGPEVRALPATVSEAQRCVEAVLGSTAWPSSRSLFFELERRSVGAAPSEAVAHYFAPPGSTGRALEAAAVREVMVGARRRVEACWNEAVVRRTSLGGTRTFRFRVDDAGLVVHAWVAPSGEVATASDYLLDRCLSEAIRALRFAPASGEGVYTWSFAAKGAP